MKFFTLILASGFWLLTSICQAQIPPATIMRTNRAPAMATLTIAVNKTFGDDRCLIYVRTNSFAFTNGTTWQTNSASLTNQIRVPYASVYYLIAKGIGAFNSLTSAPTAEIKYYRVVTNQTKVALGAPAAVAQTNFIVPCDAGYPTLFTRGVATLTNGAWQGKLQDTISMNPSKWYDRINSSFVASSNIVLMAKIQITPTPPKGAAALVTPVTYAPTNYLNLGSISWTYGVNVETGITNILSPQPML
jgi:hypothetical protein